MIERPNPENINKSDYVPEKINGDFEGKHIVSVEQFTREDIGILFNTANELKEAVEKQNPNILNIAKGKVMASLFFEPSTRTDLSFQAAMQRLGGSVIMPGNGVQFSSVYKGEDLSDTIRAVASYTDIIILRHPQVGSASQAAKSLNSLYHDKNIKSTMINAGDGMGEHPTQALLDLYTIKQCKKGDVLTITLAGDLKHGRTVHSLIKLLSITEEPIRVILLSPKSLRMPYEIFRNLPFNNLTVKQTENLAEAIKDSNVVYWTRVQEERILDKEEYESIKNFFIMTPDVLNLAKPDTILMHPLPRKHEMGDQISKDALDKDNRSVYFQQMKNGMYIRMALLAKIMGK